MGLPGAAYASPHVLPFQSCNPAFTSHHHRSRTSTNTEVTNSTTTVKMAGCHPRPCPPIEVTREGYCFVWECCKCKEIMGAPWDASTTIPRWIFDPINEKFIKQLHERGGDGVEEIRQRELERKRTRLGVCRACNHEPCLECCESVLRRGWICWNCEQKQVRALCWSYDSSLFHHSPIHSAQGRVNWSVSTIPIASPKIKTWRNAIQWS